MKRWEWDLQSAFFLCTEHNFTLNPLSISKRGPFLFLNSKSPIFLSLSKFTIDRQAKEGRTSGRSLLQKVMNRGNVHNRPGQIYFKGDSNLGAGVLFKGTEAGTQMFLS